MSKSIILVLMYHRHKLLYRLEKPRCDYAASSSSPGFFFLQHSALCINQHIFWNLYSFYNKLYVYQSLQHYFVSFRHTHSSLNECIMCSSILLTFRTSSERLIDTKSTYGFLFSSLHTEHLLILQSYMSFLLTVCLSAQPPAHPPYLPTYLTYPPTYLPTAQQTFVVPWPLF
jgi:hypothetical protein